MRKRRYNYIPSEDIESITTWEGKEIPSEKILSGAYTKKAWGGKMAHGGTVEEMKQAQRILGSKWETMTEEQRIKATDYLIMKGLIEEDEPKVIHTQFEEEEFEYARGGGVKYGNKKVRYKGFEIIQHNTHCEIKGYSSMSGTFFQSGDIETIDQAKKVIDLALNEKNIPNIKDIHKRIVHYSDNRYNDDLPKYADGGRMMAKGSKPKVIRTQFEEEEFEYAGGGRVGRNSKIKDWYIKKYPTDELGEEINDSITFRGLWAFMHQGEDVYKVLGVYDSVVRERVFEKLSQILGVDYDVVYDSWLHTNYAKGGKTPKMSAFRSKGIHRKQTLEEKAIEIIGSQWFRLDKETQAALIADMVADGTLPNRMARGSKVAEKFSVTYTLADGKKVVKDYKDREEMDNDMAAFYLENSVIDAIVNGGETAPAAPTPAEPAAEPKKRRSLFDVSKPTEIVKATSSKKNVYPIVEVPDLSTEIRRYDELKAQIKNATAEKDMVGGVISEIGREKYLEVYEKTGKRPKSILLRSGDVDVRYEVSDKYNSVSDEKIAMISEMGLADELLNVETKFEIDKEILEKKGKTGETIGEILDDLIHNSDDIPEELKDRIFKTIQKTTIKESAIDKLLEFSNPAEVFQVIQPVQKVI